MTSYDQDIVRPAGRKFALDRSNGKLAGVCAGLARWMGVDPLWMRIGFVAATLIGFGSLIVVYALIWLLAD